MFNNAIFCVIYVMYAQLEISDGSRYILQWVSLPMTFTVGHETSRRMFGGAVTNEFCVRIVLWLCWP